MRFYFCQFYLFNISLQNFIMSNNFTFASWKKWVQKLKEELKLQIKINTSGRNVGSFGGQYLNPILVRSVPFLIASDASPCQAAAQLWQKAVVLVRVAPHYLDSRRAMTLAEPSFLNQANTSAWHNQTRSLPAWQDGERMIWFFRSFFILLIAPVWVRTHASSSTAVLWPLGCPCRG